VHPVSICYSILYILMIDLAPHNPYGLALKRPVLAAAGCFGYGVEYARLVDIAALGAIVTRSTTLHGRRFARPPRLIETPAGLLAVGNWPDPGLARVIERHEPVWAGWDTPVLISVAGAAPDEYAAFAAALEGVEGIAGLELNLAAHAGVAARIVAAARAATQLPLLAKLPPFGEGHQELAALARSLADAGADALVAISSPRGVALDPHSGERVDGWLSGPALRPLALALVADLAAVVGVPVVGCGGIATTEDARQFLAAGAVAVQVGAVLLADPGAAARIGAELAG
jgi:dihydroorotate dehydrogenase (NAD+) catalytic subunit